MKHLSILHRLGILLLGMSFSVGCLLLMSCSESDPQSPEHPLLQFGIKVGNSSVEGVIDEASHMINISGVQDGNLITDVEYRLVEGASIYPDPKSWLNKWQQDAKFIITVAEHQQLYTVRLNDIAEPEIKADATIYPERYYGRVIKDFYYDLKLNASAIGSSTTANELFVTDDMNGLRISIYGDATRPAHPSAGVVDEQYYTKMISSIERAKIARGNKDLTIFASKKLDGTQSFPDWVKDANGVIVDKYATLLADYILYMKGKNIIVDVLGVDNEINFNEGNITPQKHAQIVDKLKTLATEKGFKMPLIVGPERYEPMGDVSNCWLKKFLDGGWGDRIDIYGTHYYPEHRYVDKLRYELTLIGERPFWATEPHWPSETAQTDVLGYAETAICALWDQTDLGMSGFMWWDYKRSGNLRGNLMRIASVPLKDARPIEIEDHDGTDIGQLGKLQTRAFREGKIINVYVINMCAADAVATAKAYENYVFGVNDGVIQGDIEYIQWTDASSIEGAKGTVQKMGEKNFSFTLPIRSITYLRFEME